MQSDRNGVDLVLTDPQRRALIAVRDGQVERYYDGRGNKFVPPPGVSARAVWALERRGLIKDGDGRGRFCTMQLNKRGKEALDGRPDHHTGKEGRSLGGD